MFIQVGLLIYKYHIGREVGRAEDRKKGLKRRQKNFQENLKFVFSRGDETHSRKHSEKMETKHFAVVQAAEELQPSYFDTIRVCCCCREYICSHRHTHTYCTMILGLRLEKESCLC